MPAKFATPRELADAAGIPYLKILSWLKQNKLIVLRDSQNRVLINVDRFMSSLRPDLSIGYTVRSLAPERREPIEPLDQDPNETRESHSEASVRSARKRPKKTARTQGVTSVPAAAGEPS